jgi:hypothetical protein
MQRYPFAELRRKVKSHMEANRLSLSKVAEFVGSNYHTVNNFVNGLTVPRQDTLAMFERMLTFNGLAVEIELLERKLNRLKSMVSDYSN